MNNTNWAKILLFSLISFALGVIICCLCCRMCGGGGCHRGGCGGDSECHGKSMCDHGGACCSGEGKCEKEGCDHKMGGACCKGGGHGEGRGAHCKAGHAGHHGDEQAHVIIKGLEAANFQGDTTIAIDGGTVNVKRTGEKMEVKVEMRDSLSIDKTVEVHTH